MHGWLPVGPQLLLQLLLQQTGAATDACTLPGSVAFSLHPSRPGLLVVHALHACSSSGGKHILPLQPSRHMLIAEELHFVGVQQAASGLPCSWGLLFAHAPIPSSPSRCLLLQGHFSHKAMTVRRQCMPLSKCPSLRSAPSQ